MKFGDKEIKKPKKSNKGKIVLGLIIFAILFVIFDQLTNIWVSAIITFCLFIIERISTVKKRGYFWKDKNGKELKFKEFMSRWKKGVQGITPLQQSRMNLMGIWITITGIVSGIVVNALVRMQNIWWWVEIILVGSLILAAVQFLNIYQKYCKHKEVEKTIKELNERRHKDEKKKSKSYSRKTQG